MSYLRGDPYVWGDSYHLHVWSHTGRFDNNAVYDEDGPSAKIALSWDDFDALVVMRYAELRREEPDRLREVEERVARSNGNFGANTLRKELGIPSPGEG